MMKQEFDTWFMPLGVLQIHAVWNTLSFIFSLCITVPHDLDNPWQPKQSCSSFIRMARLEASPLHAHVLSSAIPSVTLLTQNSLPADRIAYQTDKLMGFPLGFLSLRVWVWAHEYMRIPKLEHRCFASLWILLQLGMGHYFHFCIWGITSYAISASLISSVCLS